jgi:hypothetical protein
MKALRIILTLLLAPICLLAHNLLAILYERYATPVKHGMLGFRLYRHYTSWFFVILLPLCIFLGNMWWKDRRRYLFDVLLLIALTIFSLPNWSWHPYRTLLWLACVWAALPAHMLIHKSLGKTGS